MIDDNHARLWYSINENTIGADLPYVFTLKKKERYAFMKRIIITVLMAALLITSATACGKKTNDYGDESRVLYSDSDTETETETDTESESDTESDKKDSESKASDSDKEKKSSDSDKKKDSSSKKATSSKAASSKAASSKAASSKAASSKAASSKAASSKAASSAASSATSSTASSDTTSSDNTSSKADTDTLTDTEKTSGTETDTTVDTETDSDVYYDTESEIEGSDPFDEDYDLRFSYRNGYIDLYDSMDFVTSLLGDPDEDPEVVGSCSTGDVMEYDYNSLGFVITAQPSNVDGDDLIVQSMV